MKKILLFHLHLLMILFLVSCCPEDNELELPEPVGCERQLLITDLVDSEGNQCPSTTPIPVLVYDTISQEWLTLAILYNNVPQMATVEYGQLISISFNWCTPNPSTYATFTISEWCNNDWQTEFHMAVMPQSSSICSTLEKNILDYQGNVVCGSCPD